MEKNTKQKRDQHIVKTSKEPLYHTNSKEKEKKRTFSKNMITRGLLKKHWFHPGGVKSSWWSKLGQISMFNMM